MEHLTPARPSFDNKGQLQRRSTCLSCCDHPVTSEIPIGLAELPQQQMLKIAGPQVSTVFGQYFVENCIKLPGIYWASQYLGSNKQFFFEQRFSQRSSVWRWHEVTIWSWGYPQSSSMKKKSGQIFISMGFSIRNPIHFKWIHWKNPSIFNGSIVKTIPISSVAPSEPGAMCCRSFRCQALAWWTLL